MPEMTQTEYSEHRGCSQRWIARLIKMGKIPESALKPVGKRVRIISELADEALKKNTFPPARRTGKKQGEGTKQTAETVDGVTYNQARIQSERVKAQLKELELQKKTGELVSAAEVRETAFNKTRLVRDSLLNLPDRLAALLAAETDVAAVTSILKTEIVQALQELSR